MKKITPIIFMFFALSVQMLIGQNAPITTIGNVASTGASITVPITATNFNDIGSCNLQLLYDPSIATCTGVTKNPLLPGGMTTDITVAGVITIGWYTWPGATLSDNSVIFNLSFDKIAAGSCSISFDDTYFNHQWSDGSSFPLNYLPFGDYHINGSLSWQEDAPITTAPVLAACSNTAMDIPITVKDFNDIGAVSLRLHFNSSALTYNGFTNDSGFPGLFVLNFVDGVITAAGFSSGAGITLADDAVLFTIHCTFLGGTTDLTWYDDDGTSCEYAGYTPPEYAVLNDTPTSTYYIAGSITEVCESEWTGDTDDDWFDTDNWTDGIPSEAKDAIIPVVDPNPYPQIDNDATCKELDIASSAKITISTNGTLSAKGDFNNNSKSVFIILFELL